MFIAEKDDFFVVLSIVIPQYTILQVFNIMNLFHLVSFTKKKNIHIHKIYYDTKISQFQAINTFLNYFLEYFKKTQN